MLIPKVVKSGQLFMMQRAVNLLFVRHGETDSNAESRIQGQSDTPLSEKGRKQAEALGNHLAEEVFTSAYASDLARAYETAEIILSQSKFSNSLTIEKEPLLRERNLGEMEGLPVSVLYEAAKNHGVSAYNFTPKGAETWDELTERIKSFLEVISKLFNSEVEENVLVVTHGGWLKYLLLYFQNDSRFKLQNVDASRINTIPGNTGVTRLSILKKEEDQPRQIIFNSLHDTSHLEKAGLTSIRTRHFEN